jgi:uncharacterized surface protein with fasciclin (FAS1) repeats
MIRLIGLTIVASLIIGRTPTSADETVMQILQHAGFHTFTAALESTGLSKQMDGPGPLTVFAPTDAAFAELLKKDERTAVAITAPGNRAALADRLRRHVVPGLYKEAQIAGAPSLQSLQGSLAVRSAGGKLTVEGVPVGIKDISCSNGVIHVIDAVFPAPVPENDPAKRTVLETLQSAGKFHMLLAGLKTTGLEANLTPDRPLTLFAPTDEAIDAFLKADAARSTELGNPASRGVLAALICRHIALGVASQEKLQSGPQTTRTIVGEVQTKPMADGTLAVGDGISRMALPCSNGIIYVIDKVIDK